MWGRDSKEFFSHVLSLVYIYDECDAVVLCGDLNSRIGSLDDTSDFDGINIPYRIIISKTTNQHGSNLKIQVFGCFFLGKAISIMMRRT